MKGLLFVVDSRKPKEIQFSEDSITETKASPVFSAAKNKLKSSQFRYINEKLYRQVFIIFSNNILKDKNML